MQAAHWSIFFSKINEMLSFWDHIVTTQISVFGGKERRWLRRAGREIDTNFLLGFDHSTPNCSHWIHPSSRGLTGVLNCHRVRTPWEKAIWRYGDSENNVGVEWSGYPLDCYDYKSTCGAKNAMTFSRVHSMCLHEEHFRLTPCQKRKKSLRAEETVLCSWRKQKVASVNGNPLLCLNRELLQKVDLIFQ